MAVIEFEAQWIGTVDIPLEQALAEAEAGEYYIMLQPQIAEIAALGEQVTFHCEANDSQATYKWYYSDDGSTWEEAGNTTTDIQVTVTQAILDRQYLCEATFQDNETSRSNPAWASLEE